jgi:sugar phosphate isomerase/epimerase
VDLRGLEPLLETGASLGASSLTVSGDDPDTGRLADSFAALCDMAQPFGLRIDLEFMRWRAVGTYAQAAAVLDRNRRGNAGILLDVLHLDRSGGDVGTPVLSAGGPVRAVQLCDAPAARPVGEEAAIREAREGRLVPGAGDLPLTALIACLPPGIDISVEAPDAARPAEERLARAWAATQALFAARRK